LEKNKNKSKKKSERRKTMTKTRKIMLGLALVIFVVPIVSSTIVHNREPLNSYGEFKMIETYTKFLQKHVNSLEKILNSLPESSEVKKTLTPGFKEMKSQVEGVVAYSSNLAKNPELKRIEKTNSFWKNVIFVALAVALVLWAAPLVKGGKSC
jgi:cell division protein FtsL